MTIPALYDALWVILPTVYILLAAIVLIAELRHTSETARVMSWTVAQLLVPVIGFVARIFIEFPRLKRLQQDG